MILLHLSAAFLLLFVGAASGFEYFVHRNNHSGLCTSNQREHFQSVILPIQNLNSGLKFKDTYDNSWDDGWTFTDFERRSSSRLNLEYRTIVTSEFGQYKRIILNEDINVTPLIFAQAANAILLITFYEMRSSTEIYRVSLDMVDDETELKYSTAEQCENLNSTPVNCVKLDLLQDKTHGHGVLLEGSRWTMLDFIYTRTIFAGSRESLCLKTVRSFKRSPCMLNWRISAIISQRYTRGLVSKLRSFYPVRTMSATTHESPGIFRVAQPMAAYYPSAPNKASRSINSSHRCLQIAWSHIKNNKENGWFSVSDSHNNTQEGPLQVINGSATTEIKISEEIQTDYKVHLINVTATILFIGSCAGQNMQTQGPADGCALFSIDPYFYAAYVEPTYLYSAQFNPSMTVEMSEDEMERVCSELGISKDDEKESIKVCGKLGCKYELCWNEPNPSHTPIPPPIGPGPAVIFLSGCVLLAVVIFSLLILTWWSRRNAMKDKTPSMEMKPCK